MSYARFDREVGYVQGMNFIAATLVYHASSAQEALRVFVEMMVGGELRRLFLADLSMSRTIAYKLTAELRRLSYDLYSHMVIL